MTDDRAPTQPVAVPPGRDRTGRDRTGRPGSSGPPAPPSANNPWEERGSTHEVPATRTPSRARAVRTFLRHLVEMLVAMAVGMMLLGAVWTFVLAWLGWPPLDERPVLATLVMATDMTLAMTAWMRYRKHGWPVTAEMAVAMYLPFGLLLGPYRMGVLDAEAMAMLGHLLMVPAMVAVMLRRRGEFTRRHKRAAGVPTVHG